MRPEEVADALEHLIASAPDPRHREESVVAHGHRRHRQHRRRGSALVATLVVLTAGAYAAAVSNRHPPRRVAAPAKMARPAPPTTIATTTQPLTPGGVIGCPTRPLARIPAGDPRPHVESAAIRGVSAGSLWKGATIIAVYRVGNLNGRFGDVIADDVNSCGPAVATASWVVELHHPAAAQLSAVVLAHYANGWHVFGSYS